MLPSTVWSSGPVSSTMSRMRRSSNLPNTSLYCTKWSKEHEKSLKDFDKRCHGLQVENCEHGDQLSTTSCTPRKQFIRSVQQHGLLAPEEHDPTELHRKADEWRSWQEEVVDYVDTLTLGMKKVLAEIDQETDVINDLWRHVRETKYGKVMEEHTNLWRLLRRITEGESKKVVMSIKDEDGFRAWQRLKQRFGPGWTSSPTRHRHGSSRAWWPDRPRARETLLHCKQRWTAR